MSVTIACPFPGMDPYIERSAIWADFHDSLIAAIRGVLQPVLRPLYAAITRNRIVVLEVGCEEIRQPYIEIVETAAENRVVTAIEVLSPSNKLPGPGRTSYLQKREEYWNGGMNLVEIDLLREGEPTVRVGTEKLESLRPWHYLVSVTRCWPPRQEFYAVHLQRKLPNFQVPLSGNDADVVMDLQSAFTRCWDEGPYPGLLRYSSNPPGPLTSTDKGWCEQLLTAKGLRDPAA